MWKHDKGLLLRKLMLTAVLFIGISALSGISCTRLNTSNDKTLVTPEDSNPVSVIDDTPLVSEKTGDDVISKIETPGTQSTLEAAASTPFIANTPTLGEVTPTNDFISPVCSPLQNLSFTDLQSVVSQKYNVPNPYSDMGHHGVDLGSYDFHGQYMYEWPVQAVFDGKVAGIIYDRPPLGNAIIIETPQEMLPPLVKSTLQIAPGESIYHMYAHLIKVPDYQTGEAIKCGEIIGQLGNSRTVEAHLHLEMRIGDSGRQISSMALYDTSITEEERQEYLWWRTSGDFMPFDPMTVLSLLDLNSDKP